MIKGFRGLCPWIYRIRFYPPCIYYGENWLIGHFKVDMKIVRSSHVLLRDWPTVYVDGASRGNPGAAGIGYCLFSEGGHLIKRGGVFIGFATSRVAEYYALKEGVEQAIENNMKRACFISDSLMVINQMKGVFKIHNKDIVAIRKDILKLLENFDEVAFYHVKRSQNCVADREANLAIDRGIKK